ncbi:MAG: UDP-N-acetylmuramate dehydrogenase [Clostridia bacterium]
MSFNWQNEILDINSNIEINVDMRNHTYFKIGGTADAMVKPTTIEEMYNIYKWCLGNKVGITVIGNGTNLLVSDKGIRGLVIKISDNLSNIQTSNNIIKAQAGALLSSVAKVALNSSLTGFEFASGIPGTIGGAVYMNAGAYDGEMKDVVTKATVVSKEGSLEVWDKQRLALDYRSSAVAKEEAIILDVEVSLNKGNYKEILDRMSLLNRWRRERQPLDMPSAGSTFKRPPDVAGSYLIDKIGLKGYSIGGAQVSKKHAGFIVNKGGATAQDVLDLMAYVQKKVYEEEGVLLKPEVRFIGEVQKNKLLVKP